MAQKIQPDTIKTEGSPEGYVLKIVDGEAAFGFSPIGPGNLDESTGRELLQDYMSRVDVNIIPCANNLINLGSPVTTLSTLSVCSVITGNYTLRESAGQLISIDSDLNKVVIRVLDSANITSFIDSNYIFQYSTKRGIQGIQGTIGCFGPQGPQGICAQGVQGPLGPQGLDGPQGLTGDSGLQGFKGGSGTQGPQGAQGTTGSDGLQGVQGFCGLQGFPGICGIGDSGIQGLTGDSGPQGANGEDGVQGADGPRGYRGDQGPQGIRGSQGLQGDTGATGSTGTRGLIGFSIQGDSGPQGPQGFPGTQGPQGPQGDAGSGGSVATLADLADADDVAIGYNAVGGSNIGIGYNSLAYSGTGNNTNNIGIGYLSGCSSSNHINAVRNNNVFIGCNTGTNNKGEVCDTIVMGAGVQFCSDSSTAGTDYISVCNSIIAGTCVNRIDHVCSSIYVQNVLTGLRVYEDSIGCICNSIIVNQTACCLYSRGITCKQINNIVIEANNGGLRDSLNVPGCDNIAIGSKSSAVGRNTADGYGVVCGDCNISIKGLVCGCYNVALGGTCKIEGCCNVGIGRHVCIVGDCSVSIGYLSCSLSSCVVTLGSIGYSSDIDCIKANVQTITSLSDCRDKQNVCNITFGLDFINTLRPVSFIWNKRMSNADSSAPKKKDLGFIAQELQQVENTFNSALYTRLVNDFDSNYLEADPHRTYPIAVKAIQELSDKITRIRAKIENAQAS